MDDNVNKGHRDRLKTRFLNEGLQGFPPHQVLELLLFFGIPYKDTNEYAHRLITEYGSLSGVLNADYRDLAAFKGIGPHAALLLKLIPELARRYAMDRWKDRPQIKNVADAGLYASTLFIGLEHEAFYMICMNAQNRVINPALISEGTVNEAMVYPRIILENAFRFNCVTAIFAHNHPGGSTEPSRADIEMTKKLKKALECVSIQVMDHIIVAGGDYLSMAEKCFI